MYLNYYILKVPVYAVGKLAEKNQTEVPDVVYKNKLINMEDLLS